MRIAIAVASIVALSGCLQDVGATGDGLARDAAKGVVNGVVETRFPGVNAAPYTDCIIDNASTPEIVEIAQAAVVGTTPATTSLVVEIASRPDTLRCIGDNSFGLEGLGL